MRASKLLHRILKFINYANLFKINEKCYFVISWPILILFVLHVSDRLSDTCKTNRMIGLGAGFKTSTQNFEIHKFCKFMQI